MFKKIKTFLTKKKVAFMLSVMAILSLMTTTAFAGEVTPAPLDLSSVQDAITGSISVTQIVTIISAVVGAGMGFILLWFGARKLFYSIMSAFKGGKLKF